MGTGAMDAVRAAVNPTSVLGKLVLLMIVVGLLALTVGDWLFEQVFPVAPAFQHSARASLVLCACSFTAFLITAIRLARHEDALPLTVSEAWNPIVGTAVSIAIGYLIGTTIFT